MYSNKSQPFYRKASEHKKNIIHTLLENAPKVQPKSTGMRKNRYQCYLGSSMAYFKRKISLFPSKEKYPS